MNPQVPSQAPTDLRDGFGRRVTTLRLSITGRCDLRCVYCRPAEGGPSPAAQASLSAAHLLRIVKVASARGIRKVRLTGGEPLLHPELIWLVEAIGKLPAIREMGLTTNGQLLQAKARDLIRAGLGRVNVSLDTLDPGAYRELTRGGRLEFVLQGLEQARAAGLDLKLNCVVMKGLNDDQLIPLLELGEKLAAQVRFIEYMPLDGGQGWSPEKVLQAPEILDRLIRSGLHPEALPPDAGVARLYQVGGTVMGLITPVSDPFCQGCDRLRLSADGLLYPCLFATQGVALGPALKQGCDDATLAGLMQRAVANSPVGSPLARGETWQKVRSMAGMGG